MECERLSDTRKREALFIAWLKRNKAAKTLSICRRKLRHLELSEDVLASFPSGMIRIQRQYGEEFVHLEDRTWADEFAKAHQVMVLHHAQYFKQKKYLL